MTSESSESWQLPVWKSAHMIRRECSVAWQQPSGPDCKWFFKCYAAIWAMQSHITLIFIVIKQCCALSEGTNKHLISKKDVITWIRLNFSAMIRRQKFTSKMLHAYMQIHISHVFKVCFYTYIWWWWWLNVM